MLLLPRDHLEQTTNEPELLIQDETKNAISKNTGMSDKICDAKNAKGVAGVVCGSQRERSSP